MRDMMPGCSAPLLLGERAAEVLRVDVGFFAVVVERDELRGDLAADVLAVLDAVVFDVPERPDVAVRELPLLLFPFAAVFDRADVVLRDEDDLELPLFDDDDLEPPLLDEPLFDPPRDDELELLLRDEPPLLLPRDDDELLRPPLEVLRDEDPPRPDELLLRPPLELFFDEELPERELEPVDFFAPPLDERELEDFFAPPLDERELEDFLEPPLDERELDDFFEPPDDERDDDELFFEPPLLLELDDEREPLDFLVVAMQIIPPVVFGILHEQQSAICVPFAVLY